MSARGDATRDRLVSVALDLFGRRGFDGVSARDIAAAASVPLASIPYHFGTMDALYRAALERVRDELAVAIAPAAEAARRSLDGTPDAARKALLALQTALVDAIVATPAAEAWSKLLIREHFDPGLGFDLVYEDAAGSAVDLVAQLLAGAEGTDPKDEAVIVAAFAFVGEILAFRVLSHAVMRRLRWDRIGGAEADLIKTVLHRKIEKT